MLRRLVPLKKLARTKGRPTRLSASACGRALTWLGPHPASRIKDAISIQGTLDYPRANIQMAAEARPERTRRAVTRRRGALSGGRRGAARHGQGLHGDHRL